jgi:hypothetical protein
LDTSTVESNTNGYQFLNAIDGVITTATSVIAATSFVVSGSSVARNIIGKVREEL